MVIKSPFKDYYDFVANKYGGGDPRLVYARNRIVPMKPGKADKLLGVEISNCTLIDPCRFRQYMMYKELDLQYLYLVITGKIYLLSRPNSPYSDRLNLSTYRFQEVKQDDKNVPFWMRSKNGIEFGKEYPFLVELCRKVQAPVFVIARVEYLRSIHEAKVFVCGQCPILGRLGIPTIMDPHILYQDISMFMGNKMKESPDTQPPVELSNKQKIMKAGFDLVQSFRHRT